MEQGVEHDVVVRKQVSAVRRPSVAHTAGVDGVQGACQVQRAAGGHVEVAPLDVRDQRLDSHVVELEAVVVPVDPARIDVAADAVDQAVVSPPLAEEGHRPAVVVALEVLHLDAVAPVQQPAVVQEGARVAELVEDRRFRPLSAAALALEYDVAPTPPAPPPQPRLRLVFVVQLAPHVDGPAVDPVPARRVRGVAPELQDRPGARDNVSALAGSDRRRKRDETKAGPAARRGVVDDAVVRVREVEAGGRGVGGHEALAGAQAACGLVLQEDLSALRASTSGCADGVDVGGEVVAQRVVLLNAVLDVEAAAGGVEADVLRHRRVMRAVHGVAAEVRVAGDAVGEQRVCAVAHHVEVQGVPGHHVRLPHVPQSHARHTSPPAREKRVSAEAVRVLHTLQHDVAAQEPHLDLVLDAGVMGVLQAGGELHHEAVGADGLDDKHLVLAGTVDVCVVVHAGHHHHLLSRVPVHRLLHVHTVVCRTRRPRQTRPRREEAPAEDVHFAAVLRRKPLRAVSVQCRRVVRAAAPKGDLDGALHTAGRTADAQLAVHKQRPHLKGDGLVGKDELRRRRHHDAVVVPAGHEGARSHKHFAPRREREAARLAAKHALPRDEVGLGKRAARLLRQNSAGGRLRRDGFEDFAEAGDDRRRGTDNRRALEAHVSVEVRHVVCADAVLQLKVNPQRLRRVRERLVLRERERVPVEAVGHSASVHCLDGRFADEALRCVGSDVVRPRVVALVLAPRRLLVHQQRRQARKRRRRAIGLLELQVERHSVLHAAHERRQRRVDAQVRPRRKPVVRADNKRAVRHLQRPHAALPVRRISNGPHISHFRRARSLVLSRDRLGDRRAWRGVELRGCRSKQCHYCRNGQETTPHADKTTVSVWCKKQKCSMKYRYC
eukprot:Rhum_TRINITY_DN14588_c20_g1::Rhum_TRINITY_DN14588_c20_g1_i1::g.96093::m.96093